MKKKDKQEKSIDTMNDYQLMPLNNIFQLTPLYTPPKPSVLMICLSPFKNDILSSMTFVLTVSTGAVTNRASTTPAPRPATKFLPTESFPFSSRSFSLMKEFKPNRIPAFGTLPINVGARPRYKLFHPSIVFHVSKSLISGIRSIK